MISTISTLSQGKSTNLNLHDLTILLFKTLLWEVRLSGGFRLNQDTHLAKMIGVWRGRQVEEAKAQIFNEHLVDALHSMYEKDMQAGKRDEYVNLWDAKTFKDDPVLADAMSLMTPDTRQYVASKFANEDGFWVRRDMLNDAFGYRNASVGDAWTGNSRLPSGAQEQFKNLALTVMGNKAYQHLVNGEKLVQRTVSTAKALIVVKSIKVAVSNMASNFYQLVDEGISPVTIARSTPKKLAEVQAYMKSRQREVQAEAELRAAEDDVIKARKLQAEIKTIQDSYRRMSIWPLVQAGELGSISHDVSQEDMLLNGKVEEYFQKLADRLPPAVKAAGRYALITKDTALYQGLAKALEYGDFIAKAIMYDHLVGKKKLDAREALGEVAQEFVNYDLLPGRARGYLEGMGMLWFMTYKIGSVRTAVNTIRKNPVHALLAEMLPHPPGIRIGSPESDNLFSKALEGTLSYSIGPGMGFRSLSMNPWSALAF